MLTEWKSGRGAINIGNGWHWEKIKRDKEMEKRGKEIEEDRHKGHKCPPIRRCF